MLKTLLYMIQDTNNNLCVHIFQKKNFSLETFVKIGRKLSQDDIYIYIL